MTEAFVRQVVDRMQGVIEAKLTPPWPSSIPVLSKVFPGANFQSPPFYPTPYKNVSPLQVGYSVKNVPQVGYRVAIGLQPSPASIPQDSATNQRIVSEVATNNTLSTIEVSDTNKRCCTCGSEQQILLNGPSKINSTIDASSRPTVNKSDQNNTNECVVEIL